MALGVGVNVFGDIDDDVEEKKGAVFGWRLDRPGETKHAAREEGRVDLQLASRAAEAGRVSAVEVDKAVAGGQQAGAVHGGGHLQHERLVEAVRTARQLRGAVCRAARKVPRIEPHGRGPRQA